MAEILECSACHNRRTVPCPCCSGKGWVEISPYAPHLGKAYVCVDCEGHGEVPCPRCRPAKQDIYIRNVPVANKRIWPWRA